MKKEIAKLVKGFKIFQKNVYNSEGSVYGKLSQGQSPKTLVIGCSDSRVDPAHLSSTDPGDLFVVRNVANLVPPYEESTGGLHGVSAAIEFAVVNLKVENIFILGHRQCGGIKALLFPKETKAGGLVQRWMSIAAPAKAQTLETLQTDDPDELCRHCELEALKVSMANLRTFPFVAEAIGQKRLNILGLYFDLETGELLTLDSESGEFQKMG